MLSNPGIWRRSIWMGHQSGANHPVIGLAHAGFLAKVSDLPRPKPETMRAASMGDTLINHQ
jgi:hypothetical protein